MKQFFNRSLALLLAVVLCFSMVPMAAFATEVDSGASSAIEDSPIDSPPQDAPQEIDSEMQDVDVPVVFARDPISKVQSDLGGGTNYLTSYGVTRKAIVDELSAHEHDSYYLGTPYAGGDVQSPNGDTAYNGSAGMNCGGFVGYVLRKVGLGRRFPCENRRYIPPRRPRTFVHIRYGLIRKLGVVLWAKGGEHSGELMR